MYACTKLYLLLCDKKYEHIFNFIFFLNFKYRDNLVPCIGSSPIATLYSVRYVGTIKQPTSFLLYQFSPSVT